MPIPPQEHVDWGDPEEHISWGMVNMPSYAGVGAVTNEGFLRCWSRHLVEVGFTHVDYLRSLADANGYIHVDQLPKQTKKWQPAVRGPRHGFNNAARWVPADQPTPPPMRVQDMRGLTNQERGAVADQLIELGTIRPEKPPQHQAAVVNERPTNG